MADLKRLFELVGSEGGKVFVVDETGEVKFVILNIDDYQKLKRTESIEVLSRRVEALSEQAENLNRAVTEAQMEDWSELEEGEDDPELNEPGGDSVYIEPIEER